MPIVQFYLVEGEYEDAAIGALLVESSHFYVDTLYPEADPPPLQRVRAFVTSIPPGHWATGGALVSSGAVPAPYFTCLALAGRRVEQLQQLTAGFTELIVKHLKCDRALVRGTVLEVDPQLWAIGGQPAQAVRAAEIASRSGG